MKDVEVAVRRMPREARAGTAQNGRYDNLSRLAFRTDSTRFFAGRIRLSLRFANGVVAGKSSLTSIHFGSRRFRQHRRRFRLTDDLLT